MKEAKQYTPYFLKNFQGFKVKDYQESHIQKHIKLVLQPKANNSRLCARCGEALGRKRGEYYVEAKHLKAFGWTSSVRFPVAKCECKNCGKIRSEWIPFTCPTSPHITLELAWWLNRLSEITSVNQVSKLESIDKMACYKVDKYLLRRFLQGYEIPKVTHIAVDEVYARRKKKKGENRNDLFLTVVVDLKTRKVLWVSKSRDKEALDVFFQMLGVDACKDIQVVATDQHDPYTASVNEHCPSAKVVWDRFHLVQKFNEALNEERKQEWNNIDPEGEMGDLLAGKYRYLFLMKSKNRKGRDIKHINEVLRLNERMTKLELIKEHFHRMFECDDKVDAQVMLCECYEWAWQAKAQHIVKWIWSIMDDERFWNYFEFKVTTSLSEGINNVIKTLKRQAYGYKDMNYFALKIMQKCGYLNSRYYFLATN